MISKFAIEIDYPMTPKNNMLLDEFNLFNSILYCFLYNQNDFQNALSDFKNKSKIQVKTEIDDLICFLDFNSSIIDIEKKLESLIDRFKKLDEELREEIFPLQSHSENLNDDIELLNLILLNSFFNHLDLRIFFNSLKLKSKVFNEDEINNYLINIEKTNNYLHAKIFIRSLIAKFHIFDTNMLMEKSRQSELDIINSNNCLDLELGDDLEFGDDLDKIINAFENGTQDHFGF